MKIWEKMIYERLTLNPYRWILGSWAWQISGKLIQSSVLEFRIIEQTVFWKIHPGRVPTMELLQKSVWLVTGKMKFRKNGWFFERTQILEFLSQNSEFMDFGKVIFISDVLCPFKGVIGRLIFFSFEKFNFWRLYP